MYEYQIEQFNGKDRFNVFRTCLRQEVVIVDKKKRKTCLLNHRYTNKTFPTVQDAKDYLVDCGRAKCRPYRKEFFYG